MSNECRNYHRTSMQKEQVLQKLRDKGCRITKQREMLLDVILREECASCKEIYYKAKKADAQIGAATVYRMINLLEETGAISRKNMYKISESTGCREKNCVITFDDNTSCRLSMQEWYRVMLEGLKVCGYAGKQQIKDIDI